jgi:hypothetical protein
MITSARLGSATRLGSGDFMVLVGPPAKKGA